jgi:VWFA-related protein
MLKLRVAAFLCLAAFAFQLNAQSPPPQQPKSDEVVRISTQLVQTDILVLDKNGQFVEGLKPEEFEIRVNGRPRPILFLDQLTAGTANEEIRMATARGRAPSGNTAAAPPADRGRTIFFYLDDLHLSAISVVHTREMLLKFLESEMRPDDELGIFTATGQLGFFEQLTNEKVVLRAAIEKIKHRSFQATDAERPPMSETEAMAIMNGDARIMDYFVEQLLRDLGQPRPRQPSVATRSRSQYETMVRNRAKSVVDQVAAINNTSVDGFERFVRSSAQLPWQKLAFFVSDGFQMVEGSNSNTDLRRIADAASHSATIIYSIDARGLISGAPDSSRKAAFDSTGRLASAGTRPITSSQEPLRILALDSGGLPILDTNEPLTELRRAVRETSNYYQLAWRPDEQELNDRKFQVVEVKLPQHPNLHVRVRQGFFFQTGVATPDIVKKESQGRKNKDKKKEPEGVLAVALRSTFPRRDLPVALSAGYIDSGEPNLLVTASLEIPRQAWVLDAKGEDIKLDMAGVLLDDGGKPVATFEEDLTVKPAEILSSPSRRVVYNHQFRTPPGLYQVRVAMEEKKTGRVGSATQWLEIPNPKSSGFLVSSLFIGEVDAQALSSGNLSINANHQFAHGSRLGFMTYVYNAEQAATGPDIAIQVIVMRQSQPVLTNPLIKVNTTGQPNLQRIPYGEDLDLSALPAGTYVLQITAIDRVGKKSGTQQSRFSIY